MYLIVPFNVNHAMTIHEQESYFDTYNPPDKVYDWNLTRQKAGNAFTLYQGNEIVGCGGIMKIWDGFGEAWTLFTRLLFQNPKTVHKTVKYIMGELIKEEGFKRVQAVVDASNERAVRWIERLGFEREGLMRKYIGDKDFYLYARIS